MTKDKRYKVIKVLIESGHIKAFNEVFDTLPKTVVAKDFGTNYQRFTRLINNPDQFRLRELYSLAALFEIDPLSFIALVHAQYMNKKSRKKK